MLTNLTNHINATLSRVPRHINYVSDIQLPTCALVQTLPPEDRCQYINKTKSCNENTNFIDFMNLIYCIIAPHNTVTMILASIALITVCSYIFLALALTADSFFCPSLKVVSHLMGLSENVAGVTLLAFGNCAPDFFTSIAGVNGESRRVYSDTLGSALFVVLVVAGSIATFVPFAIQPGTFLRDVLFLLLGVCILSNVIVTGRILTIADGVLILSLYVAYIIIVILDQLILMQEAKSAQFFTLSVKDLAVLDIIPVKNHLFRRNSSSRASTVSSIFSDLSIETNPNQGLFIGFFNKIKCFDLDDWLDSTFVVKIITIVRWPILFFMTLFIPVVDYEENLANWSKLLNTIQIITLPQILYFLQDTQPSVSDWYGFLILLALTIPIAVYVFLTSRTDSAPKYHKCFAFLGVPASIYVIYALAGELNSVLEVLGIISSRSNSFLGCTLLAWGNSMGDLTANIVLARHGYPIMGFAACFGGPLFSSFVILGLVIVYKCSKSEDYSTFIGAGTVGVNCAIFLIISLIVTVLGVSSSNFVVRRSMGMFMLCMYSLYFSYSLLDEFEIVHAYGTDHTMDLKPEKIII